MTLTPIVLLFNKLEFCQYQLSDEINEKLYSKSLMSSLNERVLLSTQNMLKQMDKTITTFLKSLLNIYDCKNKPVAIPQF